MHDFDKPGLCGCCGAGKPAIETTIEPLKLLAAMVEAAEQKQAANEAKNLEH